MPGLPDRPDLDQLRRQARELLRAASGGEPTAVARIRAVSERMTLAAAQLALAREYGCRNWAALRAEVERRRSPLDRWSFGGAAAIEVPSGMLLPEGLVASADMAVLFTSLTPSEIPSDTASDNGAWLDRVVVPEQLAGMDEEIRALHAATETGDITVVDDQGVTYTLRTLQRSGASGPFPSSVWFRVEPVPGQGIEWLELAGRNGTATRLRPSPRAVVRLGLLTPVTTSAAERELTRDAMSAMLDAAQERTDGPRHHLDLGITLPLIDGMTFQLDSLVCAPTGWSLFMRARPRWWRYRDDRRRKWSPVEISAEDDRGCSYLYGFGGSSGRDGCEEIRLQFRPRLDPLARRLRLTCTGSSEQIAIDLDLPPGALGRG
jgi:hypothetical protein